MSAPVDARTAVAEAFRDEWGQVVATLIRVTGDWDLAEECAQDALTLALQRWESEGVPRRPGAWLTTVARNRAVDRMRRAAVGEAKLREVAAMAVEPPSGEPPDDTIPDDVLRLMFTCCHPALAPEARVALTLRALAGLTTAEIARAFLVSEQTMAKRLTRAKQKIRHAVIPFRVPGPALLPGRLRSVLSVLYLLFNEGYSASSGDELVRRNLTAEAVRLTRVLTRLMPDEPEAAGLLALMLLHDARTPARTGPSGALIPLEEQDRSLWDRPRIEEGVSLLDRAMARRSPGPYQVQAAIAACHATAPTPADTDWPQIAALYARLSRLTPSPVVELNRAVAVAMARGPAAALPLLDALDSTGALAGHHLLPATRADLLRRLSRPAEAATAYRQALALVPTAPERRYLAHRLAALPPPLSVSPPTPPLRHRPAPASKHQSP
ncbi:RNA polymerase sigma factor [Actinocorallia populi]|uniref:RNA polymerase sigma factor n=1 Tax=Actinocorallia populi TaxID=2079200 RepID=UPI000D0961E9|nr:RNA polymerase sigma factor [Actinocorallia populi]